MTDIAITTDNEATVEIIILLLLFLQSFLEINKIEINDKTLQLPIPSVTGNLRLSDKIRKDFPSLPYTTENQQFIKKVQL